MRTQVCIVGGGPAGLLLSHLLHLGGIDSVVLEKHTRAHVLERVRAGVLEQGSTEVLRQAGVGARMDREGFVHHGVYLSARNEGIRIDFEALTGRHIVVYGQTEVTHDLYAARDAAGGIVIDEAKDVTPLVADRAVTFVKDGAMQRVDCDFIIGCDGFHGVCRAAIPDTVLKTFERVYPFGWLGILSQTRPVSDELIYANHARGFALCSMRNEHLSRYYIQVPLDDPLDKWPDQAFWDELRRRIPQDAAGRIEMGPSVEKSLAPLRSFVAEPMRWGNLFLAGDAAHIVPPTGAKGLNLAIGDIHYLHDALVRFYGGDAERLDAYSDRALGRVWHAIRFSWWLTTMLHRFPDHSDFEQRIQESEIDYLEHSRAAQSLLAEQYVGLPYW
ncbi:MAG: 4-hydroxybenzoate 3-monooxygenase [Acuticoccus sp.]